MSPIKEATIIIFAMCIIYIGALPLDKKCDLTEAAIDYTIDGAAGAKDMLNGDMDLLSYLRHNVAKHLKDFWDQSDCT